MRFSTKCWSEHILSAYKASKDLKHPLYMTFNQTNKQISLQLQTLKFFVTLFSGTVMAGRSKLVTHVDSGQM